MSDSEWYFESSDSSASEVSYSDTSSSDTSSSDSSDSSSSDTSYSDPSDSSYEELPSSNCDDLNRRSLYDDEIEKLSNCLNGLALETSDKQKEDPMEVCSYETNNIDYKYPVKNQFNQSKRQLLLELFGEISSSEDESDNSYYRQKKNEALIREERMKRRRILLIRRRITKT